MVDDVIRTENVPTQLANGAIIRIQATSLGDAATIPGMKGKIVNPLNPVTNPATFDSVTKAIEGIAESVVSTLKQVKPRSASVEFGLEIALETGNILTALLVKGTGTANLKITLEWGETDSSSGL